MKKLIRLLHALSTPAKCLCCDVCAAGKQCKCKDNCEMYFYD